MATWPDTDRSEGLFSKRPLLIAGLGTPETPARGEAAVARLAREVARLQPDRHVACATLANCERLASVAGELEQPIVFPHFVADGPQVSAELPRQLGAAGVREWVTTVPFGLLQDLRPRTVHALKCAMRTHGLPTGDTTLILAVDGDPCDSRKALAAEAFARALLPSRLFKTVLVGVLRDMRFFVDSTDKLGHVLVVPFMAEPRRGFDQEIMLALSRFGAIGPILHPIGTWSVVPALISHAVRSHARNALPETPGLFQS